MYQVEQNPDVPDQVAALPHAALPHYAELRAALEVSPWAFPSADKDHPDRAVRSAVFGEPGNGLAFFVILEDQRRVVIVKVLWAG